MGCLCAWGSSEYSHGISNLLGNYAELADICRTKIDLCIPPLRLVYCAEIWYRVLRSDSLFGPAR